ncbi:MAG: ABC transporter substrate-binding protein [Paludibacteraceae bacterium]|nr:ABC transporter substrate-binding protein [Paludibacteraceae bacterium]
MNKQLKSLIVLVMAALLLCPVFTQAADRAHTLKVYNWADYIDMDNVLNKFPAWYKQQTGEDVEIIYQTFDINESMLTEIEIGHEDYDVICPSEYIIERMLRRGLLQPINKNFGSLPDYTKLVAPFAQQMFQQMVSEEEMDDMLASDYTVGYMWGTTGLLYNPKFVDAAEIRSLGGLLNPKFKDRIFMKDAFRDVYSVVVLYAYKDEIARGEVTRADLVGRVTEERIARVEEFLREAKGNIAGWEVDFGKEEMAKGKSWLNLSWSGDAQWAIDEAAEVGVELKYLVPEEGSNVWFDGWCIPKYAQNVKAASYFINYLCMPENAILNMEEIGYVSVISSPEILAWADQPEENAETVDLTYFFGPEATAVHANQVLYPDKSVIDRCALMHDCDTKTAAMLDMWNRVKGDNLGGSNLMMIVGVVIVLLIVFFVILGINKNKQKKLRNRRR